MHTGYPSPEDASWLVFVDGSAGAGDRPPGDDVTNLLAVGDGQFGTRGAPEEQPDNGVLASGVYDDDASDVPRLLEGPTWTGLHMRAPIRSRRWLDLRDGTLHRHAADDEFTSVRFAAIDRPGLAVMRAEGAAEAFHGGAPLLLTGSGERGQAGDEHWARVAAPRGGIAAAAYQSEALSDGHRRVDRVSALAADTSGPAPLAAARARLADARSLGVDYLVAEQRRGWEERWRRCALEIHGDEELTLGARYAVFQLLCSTAETGEAAVGARGLSGHGYAGHVFWDTDVFVLGALAALRPRAARAILEYRIRRLDVARLNARRYGRAGARFPWESALDGSECTPSAVLAPDGQWVPVLTAEREEHIIADVAWAAWEYARWTGDTDFLRGPGRALVTEGARYWASRVELDADGRAHIRHVIGPDEYHEDVDDNAFTNVMARWNLRQAAHLVESDGIGGSDAEIRRWRDVADRLVDGFDPVTGRHEQFEGFSGLKPAHLADLMRIPGPADAILSRDTVAASQVVKQADVLMLHWMVPDEVPAGSLNADLDYYGPRTSHGSSLSPAVYAALLARAGQPDDALPLLRWAALLDLRNLNGTTRSGLHLATMGSVWRALAVGFAGLGVRDDALGVDPRLPSVWEGLTLRLTFRSAHLEVEVRHGSVTVTTDSPVRLAMPDGTTRLFPVGSHQVG